MWRQDRYGHQESTQPPKPCIFPHHVTVGHHVRPADFEDSAMAIGQIQCCHQIREHIVDGDGLRKCCDPPRTHHDRQAFDERLNDLERQAAGPDDDRCAKLDDRNATRLERVTRLGAAPQMGGERTGVVGQSAKINDAWTPAPAAARPKLCAARRSRSSKCDPAAIECTR